MSEDKAETDACKEQPEGDEEAELDVFRRREEWARELFGDPERRPPNEEPPSQEGGS